MQKLSWKTMDKLYTSCRVFHQEYDKLGLAFFWFLYDLQVSTKLLILFKMQVTRRSSKLFKGSQMCPQFAPKPSERYKFPTIGSLGLGGGVAGRNSARPVALSAGGGVGCDWRLITRPLVTRVEAERSAVSLCCRAGRRQPWELQFWWGSGTSRSTSGSASSSRT
jgi:hypothetical protein